MIEEDYKIFQENLLKQDINNALEKILNEAKMAEKINELKSKNFFGHIKS